MAELHRLFERYQRRYGEVVRADDKIFVSQALTDAEEFVLDYIKRDTLPAGLESDVTELALVAFNKRGAEGESSRSEGGISRAFADIPPRVLAHLNSYPRKVGVIRAVDEN